MRVRRGTRQGRKGRHGRDSAPASARPMTAADGLFFAADSPTSPQIIGGLVLLSAVGGRSPVEAAEAVAGALREASAQLPVLRQRLRYRFPRWLRRPHWPVGGPPDADAVRSAVLPDESTVRRRVA